MDLIRHQRMHVLEYHNIMLQLCTALHITLRFKTMARMGSLDCIPERTSKGKKL